MHIPVMKEEVLNILNVKKGGLYIDCTFGEGGHTQSILEKGGVVIALDRDSSTLNYANRIKTSFPETFYWVHSSFANLNQVWGSLGSPMKADGILFDLGFSSNQIEDASRGFSFMYDSSLDMRYDIYDKSKTALDLINSASQEELAKIFIDFGEEKFGSKIAHKIHNERKKKRIKSCFDLISILRPFNSFSNKHFATKIFQALRIYVNDELFHIEKGISYALDLIKFHGKVVVITFHSLEDRIIKNKFGSISRSTTKNLCFPSDKEVRMNPRSRSAKVRWFTNLSKEF